MKTNKSKQGKFKAFFNKLITVLRKSAKRFPYAIALTALAAIIMIVFTHIEDDITQIASDWFIRCAMVLVIGIPLSLSIKMLLELKDNWSKAFGIIARLAGLGLLVIYLFFGLPDFESTYIVRYIGFSVFLWGMFLTIPFLKKRDLSEVFTFKVSWRLVITAFYCVIIFGGVSGILFSLDKLLEVNIQSEHYVDALIVIAGMILPTFFFAGIPKKGEKLPETLTKFFRILLIYVIMPILSAYTVVLYLYFIKMLIEQVLPNNIIGNLVLWYSIIGIVILYLAKPEVAANKWARIFDRWFPRLLFVPLGMLFLAIFIRIDQYGITEPRYYMMIGAFWVLAMTLYLVIKGAKKRYNVIIPLTISLVALLTVIGPWGAMPVARRSQNKRFETLLTKNDMLTDWNVNKNSEISEEDKNQMGSIVLYFSNNHEISDLWYFEDADSIKDVEEKLGFEVREWYPSPSETEYIYYNLNEDDYIFDLDGYDYVYFSRNNSAKLETKYGDLEFDNDYDSMNIKITLDNNEIFNESIVSYAKQLKDRYTGTGNEALSADEMTFYHDIGEFNIKVIFFMLEANLNQDKENADEKYRYGFAEYIVFVGVK